MLDRVRAYVKEHQMIEPGGKVAAGVSGGPDSICLLLLLKELCRELEACLCAVHVHHGLRGEEADEDEAFVRELCAREGIPLRVFSFDVRERAAREKLSLEEAGRLCRYEAFRETAAELGGARIAVAHHADDQAETVLFHLFRGTGIRGLCGMEPVHDDIIRPLLGVRRQEILEWLESRGLDWRTDSTNESVEYTRNRIRSEILPCAAAHINARAVPHIAEAAGELSEIERFLEKRTEEAFRLYVREEEEGCFLFEAGFEKLDPVLQRRLLRLCMERTGGLKDVERVHIQILLELMEKQTGSRADLPGGRQARREYRGISLKRAADPQSRGGGKGEAPDSRAGAEALEMPESLTRAGAAGIPAPVKFPESLRIGGRIWSFSLENAQKDKIIPQKTYTKWFDYDKIKQCLVIRKRQPGDYLEINRDHGRKKLKAYLVDEKVPAAEREQLWLLADGPHILWVPGYRISEGYKVTQDTERILKVQIDGGENDG